MYVYEYRIKVLKNVHKLVYTYLDTGLVMSVI